MVCSTSAVGQRVSQRLASLRRGTWRRLGGPLGGRRGRRTVGVFDEEPSRVTTCGRGFIRKSELVCCTAATLSLRVWREAWWGIARCASTEGTTAMGGRDGLAFGARSNGAACRRLARSTTHGGNASARKRPLYRSFPGSRTSRKETHVSETMRTRAADLRKQSTFDQMQGENVSLIGVSSCGLMTNRPTSEIGIHWSAVMKAKLKAATECVKIRTASQRCHRVWSYRRRPADARHGLTEPLHVSSRHHQRGAVGEAAEVSIDANGTRGSRASACQYQSTERGISKHGTYP